MTRYGVKTIKDYSGTPRQEKSGKSILRNNNEFGSSQKKLPLT